MSLANTLKSFATSNAAVSLVVLASLLSACGGGGGGSSGGATPQSFTIGGTVTGLTGTGLTLQNNSGNSQQVAAGATSFVFSTAVSTGGAYAVTVSTQPSTPVQTCTVTGGSGLWAQATSPTSALLARA